MEITYFYLMESSDEAFFLIHDVMSVVRKLAKGVRERCATQQIQTESNMQDKYFVSSSEQKFIRVPFERSPMTMMMMMIRRIGEYSRIRSV